MSMNMSDNKFARIFTLCGMYFAQGVPFGFVSYVLASYFAGKGLDANVVANLTALATLPWVFKFVWGPMIDRYTYRAMGRRRPWILFAQTMMVVTIAALVLIPDVTTDLKMLGLLVFIHNVFASMQDVSVDALAVEVLEENERGFVNGLMFGSASGGAAFSGLFLGQFVMGHWGLRAAMIAQAGALFCVMMLPLFLRERKGEKMLPWTAGKAMGVEEQLSADSGGELWRLLKKAFSIRSAIMMIFLAVCVKIAIELHGVVGTVYYIQELGWTDTEFMGTRGKIEIFTLLGCLTGGFLADRIGHKKIAITTTILFGVSYVAFALKPELWQSKLAVEIFFGAEGGIYGALSVSLFAMCMDISLPAVAGTQFTAYMAMMNGSAVIGKKMGGWFYDKMDYAQILIFWGVFQAVVITVLLLFIDQHQRKKLEAKAVGISNDRINE
ncbi:MAG TPA: MFS transporter [Phycisphaerales bacterium]|nr:MFS transporter [Phycisphaerales bacterium]